MRTAHEPVRCTAYRPDIGGLLPVYVADRYDGIEARPFLELTDEEIEAYIERNVAAVREVAERVRPDLALANHLVMGPVILARALGPLGIPYAVKVHGSALEYVVKRDPERFLPYAREGVAPARAILVGSRHTAESLWEAMDDPALPGRTRLGPPGVDVEAFAPRRAGGGEAQAPRAGGAAGAGASPRCRPRARRSRATSTPRGASWRGSTRHASGSSSSSASSSSPRASTCSPPPGRSCSSASPTPRSSSSASAPTRRGSRGSCARWRRATRTRSPSWRAKGAAVEGGPDARRSGTSPRTSPPATRARRGPLARAEPRSGLRVRVIGRLEHDELHDLLPACDAQVVPSTFPEAFGMVAAEGAACGLLPVSAGHSGLAEVSAQLAEAVPPEAAPWLSFPVDDDAVEALADRIASWLEAPEDLRRRTREALVATARERFSWDGVARDVIAAAEGRLDDLRPPRD